MTPSLIELEQIIKPAAMEELLPRFAQTARQYKSDGSIVTEADLTIQMRLKNQLAEHWPKIPLLGEEMSEEEQQHCLSYSQEGVWILDPLDGTSNFAAGIPFFAVSIALLKEGEIQCGLIYDPVRDECFTAVKGQGTCLNNTSLTAPQATPPLNRSIALIDFKRLPARLAQALVATPPYSSQRSFGSGALDWCWLAAGRVHVYLHGQQKLWDIAAGSLILSESGGKAVTLDNEPVFRPALQPRSVVAAKDANLFVDWRNCVLNPGQM